MKYNFLLIVIFFSCTAAPSQNEVSLTQSFAIGDTYQFEVKRGKEDSRNPASKGVFTVTSATATVSGAKKDERIVTFKYGESRIVGVVVPPEVAEQVKNQELYYGIEISLKVDSQGNFLGLSNYDEAKQQIGNAMIKMYERKGNKMEEAVFNQVRQQLAVTFDTEEKLLDTYFPELSLYFNAFGNSYIRDKPQELTYETTNPFGGEAFPMSASVVYNDLIGTTAIIKGEEKINQEDLRRIMVATFKKIAQGMGKLFDEAEIPAFNMSTASEIRYDTKSNSLRSVSINKHITTVGIEQNVITEIKMLD
ncbi:MAG: hypothetical protein RIG68_15695 [Imperialibacter sp.]|uniref:hypothetical protein n=1 Tax=Imperialibacter sp. TaxID=2038411 RepID=UPI0032EAEE21